MHKAHNTSKVLKFHQRQPLLVLTKKVTTFPRLREAKPSEKGRKKKKEKRRKKKEERRKKKKKKKKKKEEEEKKKKKIKRNHQRIPV